MKKNGVAYMRQKNVSGKRNEAREMKKIVV